ncbi:MAG: restriction endonuclease subunit S [Spirochaetales bacterium]|jgi:type I restriction enzyme S subunit|nr:restriction endonuclease subunit S [Spirochaetales bacterium]
MVSEWEKKKIQDIVTILGDGLHGTPAYSDDGEYYFINGNNLENGRIVFRDKTKRVDHSQFLKFQKNLNDRTLLVSINGTIGNVAYYNGEKVVLGKSTCYFNLANDVDKRFIRYILSGHLFISYLDSYATGTTIKNVSLKSMRDFSFKLPPLSEQKNIAHILGALDDRIELNRRMNETLESMAQVLFKSWFVEFDPVIDNGLASGKKIPEELRDRAKARAALGDKRKPLPEEIRALFPDEFTHSAELGWIPKGWEVKTVSDFVEKLSKGTTARKVDISNAKDEPKVPFLKVKDIDDKGIIKTEKLELIPRSVHEGPLKRSVLKEGDILFSIAGTIGRTAVVPAELHDSNSNQAIAFVRSKEKSKTYFLLQFLRSKNIQNRVHSRIVQAVQANVSLTELGNLPVIYACEGIINYLNEHLTGIYHQKNHLHSGSERLKKLRDTLLPKLLSGEVRIPEAEKMVEELAL